jgi:Ca2+-binding RTX toxin-like protein
LLGSGTGDDTLVGVNGNDILIGAMGSGVLTGALLPMCACGTWLTSAVAARQPSTPSSTSTMARGVPEATSSIRGTCCNPTAAGTLTDQQIIHDPLNRGTLVTDAA